MSYVILNKELLPAEKAFILTNDLALQRGYAAFDYFRTVNNKALFLDDYLYRFLNSCQEMGIQLPFSKEELAAQIQQLMEANKIAESGIRIVATGGYSPDSYNPVTANVIIQQQALSLPTAEKFAQGMRIMSYEYMRDLPSVKSINYLMGVWLQKQLREKGWEDVLYYQNGVVTEFPRANVFIVTKEGVLVTPDKNVLLGITRKAILAYATDYLPVEVRTLTLEEVQNAAEVFMTSTTKRIMPVVEMDGKIIGDGKPGDYTHQLNERFLQLEQDW